MDKRYMAIFGVYLIGAIILTVGVTLFVSKKLPAQNTETLRLEEFASAKGAKCVALFNPKGESVALQCDLSGLVIAAPAAEAPAK